jgi:FkbM family methyltransferase
MRRHRAKAVRSTTQRREGIVEFKHRFKLFVKRVLMGLLGYERYLFWFARFKIATLSFDSRDRGLFYLLDRLTPDATVLDIGANLGVITVQLARRVPSGKVHSFEPDPSAFRILTRIVDTYRLKNVVLHNCALGNQSGEVEMLTPIKNSVRLHGLSRVVKSDNAVEGIRFKAPIRRLDEFASTFGARIQAIKIDVEHHESQVIEGGQGLIASSHPMMYVEFWPMVQHWRFGLMKRLGYEVFSWTPSGLKLAQAGREAESNFLCIADAKK